MSIITKYRKYLFISIGFIILLTISLSIIISNIIFEKTLHISSNCFEYSQTPLYLIILGLFGNIAFYSNLIKNRQNIIILCGLIYCIINMFNKNNKTNLSCDTIIYDYTMKLFIYVSFALIIFIFIGVFIGIFISEYFKSNVFSNSNDRVVDNIEENNGENNGENNVNIPKTKSE